MPTAAIKNLASKTGKTEGEVEKLYKDAKAVVTKEYPEVEKDSDRFYMLTWGVLKKMTGLSEAIMEMIVETKTNGKNVAAFLISYKDDPTEVAEALSDKFKMNYAMLARVIEAYVNKVKKKKYKSDKDFAEALDLILKGKPGPNGE